MKHCQPHCIPAHLDCHSHTTPVTLACRWEVFLALCYCDHLFGSAASATAWLGWSALFELCRTYYMIRVCIRMLFMAVLCCAVLASLPQDARRLTCLQFKTRLLAAARLFCWTLPSGNNA
jgi:hypothetical protein